MWPISDSSVNWSWYWTEPYAQKNTDKSSTQHSVIPKKHGGHWRTWMRRNSFSRIVFPQVLLVKSCHHNTYEYNSSLSLLWHLLCCLPYSEYIYSVCLCLIQEMERFHPILMLQELEKQMHNPSRNMVQTIVYTVYTYKNEVCISAYKHLSLYLFKKRGIIQMEEFNQKVKVMFKTLIFL